MPKKLLHNYKQSDIWTEASDLFRRRKLKELIEAWQRERKAKGLPWTQQDLAKELHYGHRNSVRNWLNGENPMPLPEICKYFNVEPSFFEAHNLEDLDLVDKEHHEWMQRGVKTMAAECGVSNSFLWYLKSSQHWQDMIISNQPTDATLNSFDKDVPDVNSPYQFICSDGEKVYLNEYTMPVLGQIESKVKDYIDYLLWNEYRKRKK